jgi:hemerythrin
MGPKLWETGNNPGIVWNESEMTTGFPEIDSQHKEWISRFNEFKEAIIAQKGEETCANAILFFTRYTETHFRFEEAFMQEYRCSAQYTNKTDHEKFKARIQEITYMTWPLGATQEDVLMLEEELADWMKNHICTIDVKLRDVVKKT